MENLAPHIFRQRAVVEAIYGESIEPTCLFLKMFIGQISKLLGMTLLFGPHVMRHAEKIDPKYAGFEAQAIWCESGISLYTWEDVRFMSIDLYSCKPFSIDDAVRFTQNYFQTSKIVFRNNA